MFRYYYSFWCMYNILSIYLYKNYYYINLQKENINQLFYLNLYSSLLLSPDKPPLLSTLQK